MKWQSMDDMAEYSRGSSCGTDAVYSGDSIKGQYAVDVDSQTSADMLQGL